MGRPGIEPGKIRDVIRELDAEGKAISVTSIRERLGSGSYSTFSAVLAEWRKERAKAVLPTVPAIPEGVTHLVEHLWAEAWRGRPNSRVTGGHFDLEANVAVAKTICRNSREFRDSAASPGF